MGDCSVNWGTPRLGWLCNYADQLFSYDFRCQLNSLSNDIINTQISFSVAEIGDSKSKNLIFYEIILNTDISMTT